MESMDKAGNFIGWLHIEGVNLSVALVENALSKVHFTAERSAYYKTLVSAEDTCREKKEKVGSQNICLKKCTLNTTLYKPIQVQYFYLCTRTLSTDTDTSLGWLLINMD